MMGRIQFSDVAQMDRVLAFELLQCEGSRSVCGKGVAGSSPAVAPNHSDVVRITASWIERWIRFKYLKNNTTCVVVMLSEKIDMRGKVVITTLSRQQILHKTIRRIWRRERDSNPRCPCGHNGFRDRPIQPLWHLSAMQALASGADHTHGSYAAQGANRVGGKTVFRCPSGQRKTLHYCSHGA